MNKEKYGTNKIGSAGLLRILSYLFFIFRPPLRDQPPPSRLNATVRPCVTNKERGDILFLNYVAKEKLFLLMNFTTVCMFVCVCA